MNEYVIETDVLVIGGGMAGLFAAIKAKDEGVNVILADKGYVSRSGSTCFSDGHYAVCNPEWGHNLNDWKNQIGQKGEYLNNPAWTAITLKDSLDRYHDLLSWGVKPKTGKYGNLVRFKGGADTALEAIWLGRGFSFLPLLRKQASSKGVIIKDRVMITDLINQDKVVAGAVGFDTTTGDFYVFIAKATVICAGGGNFKPEAPAYVNSFSFDGESMAYRAGAQISGKEFAIVGRLKPFYGKKWTEKERVSIAGRKIDISYARYPTWLFWLAPIAIVGSVIDSEGYGKGSTPFREDALMTIHEGKGPLLHDLDAATEQEHAQAAEIYPPPFEHMGRVGLDPLQRGLYFGFDRNEFSIGASWGGLAGISSTDFDGATSLSGLFAAGDSYHSTAVGAAYPCGGTGTRNAAVTGSRAGQGAAKYAKQAKVEKVDKKEITRLKNDTFAPLERKGGFDTSWVTQILRYNTFPYYIFYVQHGNRLKSALGIVEFLQDHIVPKIYARDAHGLRLAHETKNRILSAEMMLKSSLFRKESRGVHYREDYPQRDDPNWLALTRIKRDERGEMRLTKSPLPRKWWPDLLTKHYQERYPNRYKGEVV